MIYILNRYPQLDRGHFWVVDGYIRRALRELGFSYTYLSLSAYSAFEADGFPDARRFRYHNIISEDKYLEESVSFIEDQWQASKKDKDIIFLSWLPQFTDTEMNTISSLAKLTSSQITGITIPTSDALIGNGKEAYRYVHERYFDRHSNNLLWVGERDFQNLDYKSNIRFLPEYGEVSDSIDDTKHWDISFFGQLSAYRGLAEFLLIGLFNPKLRLRLKGYSFAMHRSLRPFRRKIFRYKSWKNNPLFSILFSAISLPVSLLRFLPNVDFSNEPFVTEKDLDSAMRQTRAIFYGAKLPHGSGIMTKGFSSGIPILWTGWEGQAFNALKLNFDSGFIKFHEFFVPNRVSRILENLPTPNPKKVEMWSDFLQEVSFLANYLGKGKESRS
jgi:hypothetical protein